jgi:putative flavoprotein involved in K+ transport
MTMTDRPVDNRSGRPVTLAAGEHVRLPRTYRDRDIFWWLQATGLLAERYDQIDDLTRAHSFLGGTQ